MAAKVAKLISLVILLVFSMSSAVSAQGTGRVSIDHIENGQFPLLEVYASVTNAQGYPVKNLKNSDFSISEDNLPVTDFEATPVQNTQQALAIVLVMDTSGSMGTKPSPTPLENAVEAAKAFVDSLSNQDQVALVGFADTPQVIQDFTGDKGRVKTSLDALTAAGNTSLYDAIVEAVGLLKNRSERRILILITDGIDSSVGKFDFKTSIDEATRWSVPIYPIGFGSIDRNELEQIATLTGGTAQAQPNSADLQSALGVVLQVLREQYLIRYTSQLPADGKNHQLEISIEDAAATQPFIALPSEITITLPFQDGDTIGGNVLFKPQVLAPAPLAELEILIDGSQLQNILSEPFEYAWDSTPTEPGQHEFTFIVTDKAGNVARSIIALNIQPPVAVQIIAPTKGQELSGSTTVSAKIDSLSGIAKVEYLIDNVSIQTLSSPPFDITVNWNEYPKGPHLLQVKATDVNGFSSVREVVVHARGTYDILFLILVIGLGLATLGITFVLRRQQRYVPIHAEAGNALLYEIKGSNPGHKWVLGNQEIIVGRKRGNYIQLKSPKASREHAKITHENGQYVLYNLRKENPPLINNIPVPEKQALKPGDVIQFGEDTLRYEQH